MSFPDSGATRLQTTADQPIQTPPAVQNDAGATPTAEIAEQRFEARQEGQRPATVQDKIAKKMKVAFGKLHDATVGTYRKHRAEVSERRMAKISVEMPKHTEGLEGQGKDQLIHRHRYQGVLKDHINQYLFEPVVVGEKTVHDAGESVHRAKCEETFVLMFGKESGKQSHLLLTDVLANNRVADKLDTFLSEFGSFKAVDNVDRDHFAFNPETRVVEISSAVINDADSDMLIALLDANLESSWLVRHQSATKYVQGRHANEVRKFAQHTDYKAKEVDLLNVAMFGLRTPVHSSDLEPIMKDPALKAAVLAFVAKGGEFNVTEDHPTLGPSFDIEDGWMDIPLAATFADAQLQANVTDWLDVLRYFLDLPSSFLSETEQASPDEVDKVSHDVGATTIAPDQTEVLDTSAGTAVNEDVTGVTEAVEEGEAEQPQPVNVQDLAKLVRNDEQAMATEWDLLTFVQRQIKIIDAREAARKAGN